jgi:cytoskeletal protein RodZ
MSDTEAQPHSELATFGEELRREREIRGISVKEIADATKISRRFLDAIERNDHKTLPAPVFTRGFVREYARYLGLNAEEIVNRYNYAAAGDDRIEKSAHLDRLVPDRSVETERKPASRGLPSPFARVDRGIYVLLFLVVALVGAIYWTVRHRHAAASNETVEVQREPATKAVAIVPVTTATAPATTSAPVSATASTPPNDGLLHLIMTFTDNSWISLDVDHQTYTFDAQKGGRRTFAAKERFRFKTIGNAGGVELTLNDVRIPPLGREGEVIHERVFDRAYLQKVELTAGHQ